MSSRALRRAQRELEEKQLEQVEDEHREDDEEAIEIPIANPKASAFAMLGDMDEDQDEDEDDEADLNTTQQEDTTASKKAIEVPKSAKKGKKRKNKKSKNKVTEARPDDERSKAFANLDEIDRALLQLKMASNTEPINDTESSISEEVQQLYAAMSIDSSNLSAANEMRKLFGRTAVQGDQDQEPRPRQRGPQGGIAAAAAGRNAPGGRNLASLGLRRNIFIPGKEEWPRATLGGLGMELVAKRFDGSVEYRFVHNGNYQSVQEQFNTCVLSMDPDRMVQLLHRNPYHISTLLQVSEIAKQQRNNATAGELIERALFSFGRAVHSTFSHNLSQGKARLDFRRPENREFWLAAWRYISTLAIRATWRTAFEWSKLLISLSPEDDPYCIRLSIDQVALRGREPQLLVNIVESDHLQRVWKIPPNLAYSVVLAHDRLKEPEMARKALRLAIKEYPWIAARLCKELEISPIPPSIWGKEPNGNQQELLCQLYTSRAKDLWNTTEGTTLLMEICHSFEKPLDNKEAPYWLANIDEIDLARHIILLDDPILLNLLDPRIKSLYSSTSDPMPPDENLISYGGIDSAHSEQNISNRRRELISELGELRPYLNDVLANWPHGDADISEEEMMRTFEREGTTLEEFQRAALRLHQIRASLREVGVEVELERVQVEDADADADTS